MVIHKTGNRHAHTHPGVCLVRILGKSEERSKNKSCLHLVIISSLMIITIGSTPLLIYFLHLLLLSSARHVSSLLFVFATSYICVPYTVWPSTSQVSIPLMWCANSVSVPVSYVYVYRIINFMTNIVFCQFVCLLVWPHRRILINHKIICRWVYVSRVLWLALSIDDVEYAWMDIMIPCYVLH